MKARTQDCDRSRIDAFLDSSRFALEDERLLDHLNSCTVCREYMETRAADVDSWTNATRLLQPGEFDRASSDEYSMATIGSGRVDRPAAIQYVLDMLSPSEEPSRLGRLGTYEVSGVIGAGGMGVVLKAVDPALDRVVAIKVLAPHLANSGTARRRFAREAKAAAAVLHPNVIPIHSVSSDEKTPYLVMAYIRGGSLQKRLDREGPLSTIEILRIGVQIAAGLAAAHEQGLVHRDIKPENILLEEGVERITLTDFGLARAVDDASVTQPGTIAGTPQYMSPEQTRGEPVDQQSDLFSLGCVLYALCTGRPPFRADSSYAVMRKITDESPMPIRELNPEIPEWLCAIIGRLMAKKKTDRFRSAHEIHELLESCLSHVQQPTVSRLPDIPGMVPVRFKKQFVSSSTGLLFMTSSVLIVALCVLTFLNRPDPLQEQSGSRSTISTELHEHASEQKSDVDRAKHKFGISDNSELRENPAGVDGVSPLKKLVAENPLVVRAMVEKGQFTGAMNLHRVQVTQSYKGNADDVRAVFTHVTKADSEPRGAIDPDEPRMPSLAPGEYVMVLKANPVTSSFAISSFGFRVTPEPTFNYVVVRESEQHAAWPVNSPEAQAIIALCGSAEVNSKDSSEEEKISETRIDLQTIDTACKTYKLSVGSYPNSLQDLQRKPDGMTESRWRGPYMSTDSSDLLDAWGRPIGFRVDEDGKLTVFSFGPDGKADTADDIDNRSTTATTRNAAPFNQSGLELAVSNYSKQDGTHSWSLTGKSITQVAVRLHYIVDGKSVVASESLINTGNPPNSLEKMNITLQMKQDNGNVIPKLGVSTENPVQVLSQQDESALLPPGLAAKSSTEFAVRDGSFAVASDRPFVLYRGVYFSDQDFSFDDNGLESLIEISKSGVAFVAVSLHHVPAPVPQQQLSEEQVSDAFGRLYRLQRAILQSNISLVKTIRDDSTAEKAAQEVVRLFPVKAEIRYLEKKLRSFGRGPVDVLAKHSQFNDDLTNTYQSLAAKVVNEPYFERFNSAYIEASRKTTTLRPYSVDEGHAQRCDGPQFVVWLPPGAKGKIDLTQDEGRLEALVVDQTTGELTGAREFIPCGGMALLPSTDAKVGTLLWLRPVAEDASTASGANSRKATSTTLRPLTWTDLLGEKAPPNYPTEPLSLISALNNSRGEWVLAGTIREGDAESAFEAAVDIQGGFRNMIRQDSFPQWQVAIAWPREEPTNTLIMNITAAPEPNGIRWMLSPQYVAKGKAPAPAKHKMFQGIWNPATATITWAPFKMRLPGEADDTTEAQTQPTEKNANFQMVVKPNGEIDFSDFQRTAEIGFSGKAIARIGEPFDEKPPAIQKLPGGYKIFFASSEEVCLNNRTGSVIAGPRIEKVGCEGNLIFGLTSVYANSKEHSDTLGYFWLDTTSGEIVKGLAPIEWREALRSKGIDEPRLVGPEEVGGI